MFRTPIAALVLSSLPTIACAAETILCNNIEPAQWIDVRLAPPHEETDVWAALAAGVCEHVPVGREAVRAEARDLKRNPVLIKIRCFPGGCIIDNKPPPLTD